MAVVPSQARFQLLCLTVALGLSGTACASGPPPLEGAGNGNRPDLREMTSGSVLQLGAVLPGVNTPVSAPVERSWPALALVFADLGIAGQVLDEKNRTYGTRRSTQSRIGGRRTQDYVRCAFQGAGASAVGGYRVRLSIVSRVAASPNSLSTLATHISGSASTVEGTSTEPVRCVSTGELEQRIAALLSERVRN